MKIVISNNMYIGYVNRYEFIDGQRENVKLGFATYLPLDDTAKQQTAYNKRKQAIDNWSYISEYQLKQGHIHHKSEILDNTLMSGFKLARHVRRSGWGGGNVLWRIEDPRGFELEISSANMASIMDCCTIINGEIQAKCIWGWCLEGGCRITLLPENSEPYKQAIETTRRHSTTISFKEIKVGDVVELKNGQVGTYCGNLHYLESKYSGYNSQATYEGFEFVPSLRRRHFFDMKTHVFSISSPTVTAIKHKSENSTIQSGVNAINKRAQEQVEQQGNVDFIFVSESKINSKDFDLTMQPCNTPLPQTQEEWRKQRPGFRKHSPIVVLLDDKYFQLRHWYQSNKQDYFETVLLDSDSLNKSKYYWKQITIENVGVSTWRFLLHSTSQYHHHLIKGKLPVSECQHRPLFNVWVSHNNEVYSPKVW